MAFALSGSLHPGPSPIRADPASPSPRDMRGQTTGTMPSWELGYESQAVTLIPQQLTFHTVQNYLPNSNVLHNPVGPGGQQQTGCPEFQHPVTPSLCKSLIRKLGLEEGWVTSKNFSLLRAFITLQHTHQKKKIKTAAILTYKKLYLRMERTGLRA